MHHWLSGGVNALGVNNSCKFIFHASNCKSIHQLPLNVNEVGPCKCVKEGHCFALHVVVPRFEAIYHSSGR